jgi:hypothetical protein
MADYLAKSGLGASPDSIRAARQKFEPPVARAGAPHFDAHRKLADEIAFRAVRVEGDAGRLESPKVIILSDEPEKLNPFIEEAKGRSLRVLINPEGELPEGDILAVVYSSPKAWKPPSERLRDNIRGVSAAGPVWVSFGNPYLIREEKDKILTFSDSEALQRRLAAETL